jgi:hypothetical protein
MEPLAHNELPDRPNARRLLDELEVSAVAVLKEFEIWTGGTQDDTSQLNQWQLPQPSRHIVDAIYLVRANLLPKAIQDAPFFIWQNTLLGGDLLLSKHKNLGRASLEPKALVAIVVDYKTGGARPEHLTQIQRYIQATAKLAAAGGLRVKSNEILGDSSQSLWNLSPSYFVGCLSYLGRAQTASKTQHADLIFADGSITYQNA